MPRGQLYQIRQVFRVPLPFAFQWCTDYTPEDGQLAGDGHRRRILSRNGRKIVYETLYDYPEGWFWSRQTVRLHPPDKWTALAEGNYRNWDLVYSLRSLGKERTEFTFRGVRTPEGVGTKNPSQRAMKAELNEMWKNFGKAMRADYLRASARRASPSRRRRS
jgi:hypothetical protein